MNWKKIMKNLSSKAWSKLTKSFKITIVTDLPIGNQNGMVPMKPISKIKKLTMIMKHF